MATTIFFIHSAGPQGPGQGSSGFLSILKKSLGSGYEIRHPKMPDPGNPDYAPWRDRIAKEFAKLDEGSIIIGHSLGGSVLLKYFSEEKHDAKHLALFIVATPFWGLKGWEYDAFHLKRGFSKKLPRFGKIFLYRSLDDDVVTHEHLVRYAKTIPQALVREVDGLGHTFDTGECRELTRDLKSL